MAVAFLVSILTSLRYLKKEGINGEEILDLAIYVIIGGVVGARILYVIGAWGQYKNNPLEIFMVHKGGLVFLGGLFAVLLVIVLYARIRKINLLKLFDAITPGTMLGYAIARIGCFLNGCCFGLPTKVPWGLSFPFGSLAYSYFPQQHIHPTQLYSSASMFLAFLIIVFLYKRKKYDGYILAWGLILYSIYRFVVESFRFSTIHQLGLTPSQWLVLVVGGLAAFSLIYKSLKARV
jgi:phosphatidylglycerol:prolipoprotein diacylglycerol transferase